MKINTERADVLYELLAPKITYFFNKKDLFLEHIRALAGCSIFGSILVYFVSTTILLLRNLTSGLPFVPLSIIQAVVITVYFCVLTGAYILAEYVICGLWRRPYKTPHTWRKVFRFLLTFSICLLMVCMASLVLSLFFRNVMLPFLLIFLFYVIIPAVLHFTHCSSNQPQKYLREIVFFVIIAAMSIIWSLPAGAGGLGSQKVTYYSESDTCQEYDYYGVADGMLVLKANNNISLIPVGDGYIKYVVPEYSFLGPTKDEQKRCEVSPNSPAPEDE